MKKVLNLSLLFFCYSLLCFSKNDLTPIENQELLFTAAENGNFEDLMTALENKADPHKKNKAEDTALHIAARNNNEASLRVLLTFHINTDISGSDEEGLIEIINNEGAYNQTLLHIAAANGNISLVKFLLAKKADPDRQDQFGETPLHKAAQNQKEDCVKFLIENFANPELKSKVGWTALHWSLWMKNPNYNHNLYSSEKALEEAKIFIQNYHRNTPQLICNRNFFESKHALQAVYKLSKDPNYTIDETLIDSLLQALTCRSYYKKEFSLKILLNLSKNDNNKNLLNKKKSFDQIFELITLKSPSIQKLVCQIFVTCFNPQQNYEKYEKNTHSINCLIELFDLNNSEISKLAIKIFNHIIPDSHIEAMIENRIKKSTKAIPLLISLLKNNHFKIQESAAKALADFAQESPKKQRILCRSGVIAPLVCLFRSPSDLVRKAAMTVFEKIPYELIEISIKESHRQKLIKIFRRKSSILVLHQAVKQSYPQVIRFLKWIEVDLEEPIDSDLQKETALHKAVEEKNIIMVKALLESGIQVNLQDADGSTPLHEACRYGFKTAVALLIKAGAIVDLPNSEGWTALHVAARNHHFGCMSLLIKAKADINLQNKKGWTALHLATKYSYEYPNCVEILLKKKADTTLLTNDYKTPCYWIDHGGIDKKSKKFLKRNNLRKLFKGLPRTPLERKKYLKKNNLF